MSDPINPTPEVRDISQLPTRQTTAKTSSFIPEKLLHEDIYDYCIFDNKVDLSTVEYTDSSSESVSLDGEDDNDNEEDFEEPIDAQEIYDLINTISDPEHPLTLGQLSVVNLDHITVIDAGDPLKMSEVIVEITPTITHCSLATLIGLGIRVRLDRCLPPRFRITIKVRKGTHQSETQVNKQLNDKERVAAACENSQLLQVISNMLATCK